MERESNDSLVLFRQIETKKTSDMIIEQIQELIAAGQLLPGMRLPSERELADRFGVGRSPVRDALKKLEFYGIVRTESQRGTFVSEIGEKALQGLISSLLRGANHDIISLFETREILEIETIRLTALRANEEDIAAILEAHGDFENAVNSRSLALEEDHLFHLAIARGAKNPVLASLLGFLTPEIIKTNRDYSSREISDKPSRQSTLLEHQAIVDALIRRDRDLAAAAMTRHMAELRKRRFGGQKQ